MAQDSMRTGPRGSSDQASVLEPITVKLTAHNGGWPIDESVTAAATKFRFWTPLPFGSEAGYKVDRIFYYVVETYAAAGENFTVGVFTEDGDGTFTAVDADAFVTTTAVANSTAQGVINVLTLNGAGAGLDPTLTANANFLIGGPSDHYLCVDVVAGGSTGDGGVGFYADLVPVSGTKFTNK
tara:strand:+ start:3161 stop:3706 length:546 start_codon:yes stop_codon:yes gene_type:complete